MTTPDPAQLARRTAAGLVAAKQLMEREHVPHWKQAMIPDDALSSLIAAVLTNDDEIRANPSG